MKKLIFFLVLGLVLVVTNSVYAALTPISYPIYGERWLDVNKPSGTLSILQYLFGANNWVRINDNQDQLWIAGYGADVRAVAKYAGNTQNLWAGPQDLFTISGGNFISLTSGATATISPKIGFRFFDKSGGINWSSIPGENPDLRDHMVTFRITNQGGTNYNIGDYVIAWEDARTDYDYNDMVFLLRDVALVPEPTSMILLGMGILGLFGLRRKS